MNEKFVMNTKIREFCRGYEKSVAGDFYDALNEKIEEELTRACKRSEENRRKTVFAKDL